MKPYKMMQRQLNGTLYETNDGFWGVPIVELAGDRRILIENHRGVVEYGSEEICIKVKYGYLFVCGAEMELAKMTRDQLVIVGKIRSVMIQRKGEE